MTLCREALRPGNSLILKEAGHEKLRGGNGAKGLAKVHSISNDKLALGGVKAATEIKISA